MPTNTTTLSRRRLFTSMPAAAAAAAIAPVAANALPDLATAIPDHLDVQRVKGLAEMLERLEELPKDEANTVLKAITESLECSMDNHAHDAELLALRPQFDEAFEEWWNREESRRLRPPTHIPRSDEEIEQATDKLYVLIDKVLSYSPLTREGLKLQCKALIIDGLDCWDDRTARFIGNFVGYFGMKLPNVLTVKLLNKGWAWDDEAEEEEDESAA